MGALGGSWSAYGTSGASILHLAGPAEVGYKGRVRVKTDPTYNPYFVLSDDSGNEKGRLDLKDGNNSLTAIGTMTAGVIGSANDPIRVELEGDEVRMDGTFVHSSGTPDSLLTLDADYRPASAVTLPAFHVGASTITVGYASVATTGVVTVDSATGSVSDGIDARIQGTWRIA
jgi:hypothetical protein